MILVWFTEFIFYSIPESLKQEGNESLVMPTSMRPSIIHNIFIIAYVEYVMKIIHAVEYKNKWYHIELLPMLSIMKSL